MAATSPYQNNDYQAASTFRPYQLPVNDIFKAISAQNEFWDQGARRVKAAYDNILQLNLKTTDNRTIRDNFIKEAETQITKLSSMNLADPSIQRKGMEIFKPLLRDQDIIGEDYVLNHLDKELSTGMGFRSKDGGKNYNPTSVQNIEFEQNLFGIDPAKGGLNKRDGWRSIANSLSTYTPYTDISKEYKTIQETVKAQEIENATVTGKGNWYIQTIKEKGVSKERMLTAIQEMGSPQLKAQMRVEGRNNYYKKLAANPAQVDGYFQGMANTYYDNKINEMKSQRAELARDHYLTPNTKEYASKRQAYEEAIKGIDTQVSEITTKHKPEFVREFTGLSDTNNLSSNISKIEQLWEASSIDNIAGRLAYMSRSYDIKANPVTIAQENLALGQNRLNEDIANNIRKYNLDVEKFGYQQVKDERDMAFAEKKLLADAQNAKVAAGQTGDPAMEGTVNADGSMNVALPDVTNPDPSTVNKVGVEFANNLANGGIDQLTEVAVKSIMGEHAWQGLQSGLAADKRVSDYGVLLDTDLTAAAQFVQAFANQFGGEQGKPDTGRKIPGIKELYKNLTLDQYKANISKMGIRQFKQIMGSMVKYDNDFTASVITKLGIEDNAPKEKVAEGQARGVKFRAELNMNNSKQMNLSKVINKEIVEVLGDQAKYFPKDGIITSDVNMEKAWQAYKSDPLGAYIMIEGGGLTAKKRQLTTQEATLYRQGRLPLNANQDIRNVQMGREEFMRSVRAKTDPVWYQKAAETNRSANSYVYGDKDKVGKSQLVTFVGANSAQSKDYAGDDNAESDFEWLRQHTEHVKSRSIISPMTGDPLPTVRFTVDAFSGMTEEDKEIMDRVNKRDYKVPNLPKRFSVNSNSTADFRMPGATIVHAPVRLPQGGSTTIRIINEARDTRAIAPRLILDGGPISMLVMDPALPNKVAKEPVLLYESDIMKRFQEITGMGFTEYMQANAIGANEVIAKMVHDIEVRNQKLKDLDVVSAQ